HMLRSAGLRAAKHVGIVGECNIQYALDSDSDRYVAIEINPRLSRSSALASKATGYPLAYMSAKIGLGYTLPELVNHITKSTTACFEPSLDYIVCKHPRWDFSKFDMVKRKLGPTMKSVGEVMGVGRTFEESLQKAIRMLDIGKDGLVLNRTNGETFTEEDLEEKLTHFNDLILYHVAAAIKHGFTTERIYKLSAIDPWFIEKIRNIVTIESKLKEKQLDKNLFLESKQAGFSDKQIARAQNSTPEEIRKQRKSHGVLPSVKQIDSLAAEWPAVTNYLYLTYGGNKNDIKVSEENRGVVVLGAGPYRIGSSVEFDWGTVNMVWGLQENGIKNVSVVNCNPETVSTDYDICSRLYFEEITEERILDIAEFENPEGIITCVGGQTANNLTPSIAKHGINILGTSAVDVDRAEDRSKFSAELDKLHIQQPTWQAFSNLNEAKKFAQDVGFPVIVRPSYVLSGAAMKVVWSQDELKTYVKEATDVSPDHPVVISKFMLNSLEVDVDGISNGKDVVIGAIVEHI
ncbi:MAG: carbamoyl-phosphate synthase large subunit, partial [Nitrosopumilaceae archaeon]|nr:carbamoyl-phosphate synthase large subunit [Nitrosopumilaceae archaeon]